MNPDIELLSEALQHVEDRARKLPWADKRPWKTSTHIWLERDVPTLDFHDLGQSLAQEVLRVTIRSTNQMKSGAVLLITGVGSRSLGGHGVIKAMVSEELGLVTQERQWDFSPRGPGRFVLVVDRENAPPAATGELGWGFWLLVLVFLAATVTALLAD